MAAIVRGTWSIHVTPEERETLIELLHQERGELQQLLYHAEGIEYRKGLMRRERVLEGLIERLSGTQVFGVQD